MRASSGGEAVHWEQQGIVLRQVAGSATCGEGVGGTQNSTS